MSLAVVVGGGFYGANIAIHLKRTRKIDRVIVLERGEALLTRSSFFNQARVHRGYHYPRSFMTGRRSVVNAPRFENDFGPAVFTQFTKLYALARRNSKVTVRQMERFCEEIGASLAPVPRELTRLFNPSLIEKSWLTIEHAFDADVLRSMMLQRLGEAGVEVRTLHRVTGIEQTESRVLVRFEADGSTGQISADFAFNCTYSQLQSVLGDEGRKSPFGLKHEISEMVLVEPPEELSNVGITVMDGPFFSMMPFPARRLHSLSHVRYTPHAFWLEDAGTDPHARLAAYHFQSRADRMIRDAARYVPAIARARPHSSLFEVKTVLVRNEEDDGRPILLRRHQPHGRLFSVLGGKIDNIYDILERLAAEELPLQRETSWTH